MKAHVASLLFFLQQSLIEEVYAETLTFTAEQTEASKQIPYKMLRFWLLIFFIALSLIVAWFIVTDNEPKV